MCYCDWEKPEFTFRSHKEGEYPVGSVVKIKTGSEWEELAIFKCYDNYPEFQGKEYVVKSYNEYGIMYLLNIDGTIPKESYGGGHSMKQFKPVQEYKQLTKEDLKLLVKGDNIKIQGQEIEVNHHNPNHNMVYLFGTFKEVNRSESFIYSLNTHWPLPVYKLVNKTQEIKDMAQPKSFTKADLKTGMRVTTRRGDKFVVMLNLKNSYFTGDYSDVLVPLGHKNQWIELTRYSDDLNIEQPQWSITRVESIGVITNTLDLNNGGDTLWQEPPQKTQEEIEYEKLMSQIEQLQQQAQKLKPAK